MTKLVVGSLCMSFRWSRTFISSCRRNYSVRRVLNIPEPPVDNLSASHKLPKPVDGPHGPAKRKGRKRIIRTPPPVSTSKIHLPPISEWSLHFPHQNPSVRHRSSLRNPETAAAVAEAFVPRASRDKVIVEAFPGPGALTRALLQLPRERIQKLIILEDYEPYLEYLKPLEQIDSRVHVVPMNGFLWSSYASIESLGLLDDVQTVPWDGCVHPQLQFVSHLPQTIHGEQLIAQFFRNIPQKTWLFKYGRMPMSILLSDWVLERIFPTRPHNRCKLTVIADAVSRVKLALPSSELEPYREHFHPVPAIQAPKDVKRTIHRQVGSPCHAVDIVPREDEIIGSGMLDKWDFCLRRLFVLKSRPLKVAIPQLCPGSQILLKYLTDPDLPTHERIDVSKFVRDLTVEEWALFVRAFDQWPFAPEDLAITDPLSEVEANSKRFR